MRNPFSPWRILRAMTEVRLVYELAMPDQWLGASSPSERTIWINARRCRSQAEKRCTLTHELVHLHHGHEGHQPPAVERRVREEAARLLVWVEDLADVTAWTSDLHVAADELWVTPQVLRDRVDVMKRDGVFGSG